MRYYAPALFTMIGIMMLFSFARSKLDVALASANETLINQQASFDQKTKDAANARRRLADAKASADRMGKFMSAWGLYIEAQSDHGTVQDAITDAGVKQGLVVHRQTIAQNTERAESVSIFPFSARGQYAKVMAWLSDIDTKYPLAQLGSLEMNAVSNDAITLDIKLRFCDLNQPGAAEGGAN